MIEASPETRLFRSYWDDGLLDLVAGSVVVLLGIGYLFDWVLVPVLVVPVALVAWYYLRERVVEPRAGYVEFSRSRRGRSGRELMGAVGLGFSILLFVALMGWRWGGTAVPGEAVDALPAVLVAAAAAVGAFLTRAWRFALYAAVLAAGGVVAVLVAAGPGLPLVVGGMVAWGEGAVLLGRFMTESRQFAEGE